MVNATPRPFSPGKDAVSIVKEAGWASEPVWTGAENLAPTGIGSPDRPARSSGAVSTDLSLLQNSRLPAVIYLSIYRTRGIVVSYKFPALQRGIQSYQAPQTFNCRHRVRRETATLPCRGTSASRRIEQTSCYAGVCQSVFHLVGPR